MNPNMQGGDRAAQGGRHSETQQGRRDPAKSPMQHSAPFRSLMLNRERLLFKLMRQELHLIQRRDLLKDAMELLQPS